MSTLKINKPNYHLYHKFKNITDLFGLVLCAIVVKITIDNLVISGLTKAVVISTFFFADLTFIVFFRWIWNNRYIKKIELSNFIKEFFFNSNKKRLRKIVIIFCIVVLLILDVYLIF